MSEPKQTTLPLHTTPGKTMLSNLYTHIHPLLS